MKHILSATLPQSSGLVEDSRPNTIPVIAPSGSRGEAFGEAGFDPEKTIKIHLDISKLL